MLFFSRRSAVWSMVAESLLLEKTWACIDTLDWFNFNNLIFILDLPSATDWWKVMCMSVEVTNSLEFVACPTIARVKLEAWSSAAVMKPHWTNPIEFLEIEGKKHVKLYWFLIFLSNSNWSSFPISLPLSTSNAHLISFSCTSKNSSSPIIVHLAIFYPVPWTLFNFSRAFIPKLAGY